MKALLTLLVFAMLTQLAAAADLVPGTTSTWTEGGYTWAGNEWCYSAGLLLSPASDAIDTGVLIEGLHCPAAGPSTRFPPNADGSPCVEWYGGAPDIGACEYVPTAPAPPSEFPVVLNSTLGQPPEEKVIVFKVAKPAGATRATITMAVNDGEQCDEGKLYINENGPLQLWKDDPTWVPDAADPCRMTPRNDVDATATFQTDASWWNDGDNQVRFVHDKTTSAGFVVNGMTVAFDVAVPAAPEAPVSFTVQ